MPEISMTIFNRLSPEDVDVLASALTCWASATSCDKEASRRISVAATIHSKLLLIKVGFVPADQKQEEGAVFAEVGGETGNG